jgi:Rieske Fe-S protein
VQWQAGTQSFQCTCHGGQFDQFGDVTAGPPPVPLEQFVIAVEGERVIVGSAA